jgi:hypothetical protein
VPLSLSRTLKISRLLKNQNAENILMKSPQANLERPITGLMIPWFISTTSRPEAGWPKKKPLQDRHAPLAIAINVS